MRILSGLILLIMAVSCTDLEPVEVESYYDVDSVVSAQYEELKKTQYPIRKITLLNGVTDTSMLEVNDSSRWSYELNLFRQAGINKPELQGTYQTEREETDSGHRIRYTPLEPEKRSVRYLEVEFEKGNLRAIRARINKTNPVYGSERDLSMWFDGSRNTSRLQRYQIEGSQKMILKDSVKIRVTSEILYESK